MAATAHALSEGDLRTCVEELLDEMVNGDDSHWQAYASRMAAEVAAGFKIGLFKVWSANNRLNLAAQVRRRGEHVHGMYAGVDQWRKRNREVMDGQKPYLIFGPPSYIVRDPHQNAQVPTQRPAPGPTPTTPTPAPMGRQAAAPANGGTLRWRRPPAIEVYDYSQTRSLDPEYVEPDWSVPLAGGDLDTLRRLVQTSPVPVTFAALGGKLEHGWLDASGITVDGSRTIVEQIWTLAHELGHHHLGHLDQVAATRGLTTTGDDPTGARFEQEAALVQFFVLKMLGLDEHVGVHITAAAGAYLRSWTKTNDDGTTTPIAGHKGRRKLIKSRIDVTFRAAQTIVSAYAQYETAALVTV